MKAIEMMRKTAQLVLAPFIPKQSFYKTPFPAQQQNFGLSKEVRMLPAIPGARSLQMIDYVTGEPYAIIDLDRIDSFTVK